MEAEKNGSSIELVGVRQASRDGRPKGSELGSGDAEGGENTASCRVIGRPSVTSTKKGRKPRRFQSTSAG